MIEICYRNVTIRYNEWSERWAYDQHEDASLKKIKEHIDKSINASCKGTKAFHNSWRGLALVTITSRTDDNCFWIRDAQGQRQKVGASELLGVTPENEAKIAEYNALMQQARTLEKNARALIEAMQTLVIPKRTKEAP